MANRYYSGSNKPIAKFLILGLGLLFLGRGEKADAILEMIKTIDHKIAKYAEISLRVCAYANTGNVYIIWSEM